MFAYDSAGGIPYFSSGSGWVRLLDENTSVSIHTDVNTTGVADWDGLIFDSSAGRFNVGALPSTGFSIAMAVAL